MKNKISYTTTPYSGHEDEVLRIRNNNRPEKQGLASINWRYQQKNTDFSPIVFWVNSGDRTPVGMAGLTFRYFWVCGHQQKVGIWGDISLDRELRGKGVAKKLFYFLSRYIDENSIDYSLVLPNLAAEKSLAAADWKRVDSIVPHVFIVNPTDIFVKFLKNRFLATTIGVVLRLLIHIKLYYNYPKDYHLEIQDNFDDSFNSFWQSFPKQKIIIGDRSLAYLRWRYQDHPSMDFVICKFIYQREFVGYLVYAVSDDKKTCSIYELMALRKSHIKPICYAFLHDVAGKNKIHNIRIALNEKHPYSPYLRDIGFVIRKTTVNVQCYLPTKSHLEGSTPWFITQGDKNV